VRPSIRTLPRLAACVALAVAALVAAASPAIADNDTAVILTSGDASRAEKVRETARAWLEAHGSTVSDGGLAAKDAAKLADCLAATPERCAATITSSGADRVWLFQLEPKQRDQANDVNIVLTVFDADGQTLATNERYCDRCRPETLAGQVEKVLDVVAQAATARLSARAVIRVRTDPSGARITIDGKDVGTAAPEFEYHVSPGEHEVTATLEHYEPATRRIDLDDGDEKAITLTLEREPEVEPPPTKVTPPRRSPWPYITGGVGLAALGTGITLLALHDSGEHDGAQTYYKRERLVPGVILTATGAVVSGLSVYLFVRARHDGEARIAPAVSVSDREMTVGVQGRF